MFSGSRCSTPALNRGFLLPLNIFAPVLEEEEEEGGDINSRFFFSMMSLFS